jgi:hypothetical protein
MRNAFLCYPEEGRNFLKGGYLKYTHTIVRNVTFSVHQVTISHQNTNMLYEAANSRSQRPRGLRRRSVAARLLGSWVRIPQEEWTYVIVVCCQLEVSESGWSLVQRSTIGCVCVCVCLILRVLQTSQIRRWSPELGCWAAGKEMTDIIRWSSFNIHCHINSEQRTFYCLYDDYDGDDDNDDDYDDTTRRLGFVHQGK